MKLEKIKILAEINIDTDFLFTSFDKAAKLLLEKKVELEKAGWSSVHLKFERHYDYADVVAMGMRLENNKEYKDRLKKIKEKEKRAAKKLERDRIEYEKLKKQFE